MASQGPITRSKSKKVAEASQQTGIVSPQPASVVPRSVLDDFQAAADARCAAILDAISRISEHTSHRSTSSRSQGVPQVARSVIHLSTDASVASSSFSSSHGSSAVQQRTLDWVNNMNEHAASSRSSSKATSVSKSLSGQSKVSSRSVGTQAEVQEDKRVKATKSVKHTESKSKKKSDVKSSKSRRKKESDGDDSSSSESDDSHSSSDTDPPPRKSKRVKVSSKEEKRPRRKAIDIEAPTYGGDAYVDEYLKQFRVRARLAGWPKSEWGSRLLISLEGKARGILTTSNLSDEPSFKELSTLLKKRFGGEASAQVWRATLTQRKRGERESLTELAHSIMEAVVKAYPKRDEDTRQDLATTYFINALLDEGQQQHIFTHEADTLEQAVKLALAYENARRSVHKHSAQFRPRVHVVQEEESEDEEELCQKLDDLAKSVAILAKQVNNMTNQSGVDRRPQPQVSCLGRGGTGSHWSNGRGEGYQQQSRVQCSFQEAGDTGRFQTSAGNAQCRLSAE